MSWERRKRGGWYYTRTRRRDGRRVREYVGGGLVGFLAAEVDQLEREVRSQARCKALARISAARSHDASVDSLCAQVATMMRATLVLSGFHSHKRGEWRRRRMTTQRAISWLLPRPTGEMSSATMERIELLFPLANSGDPNAMQELRGLFPARAFEQIGDLATQVRYNLTRGLAEGCRATAATIEAKAERLAAELRGDDPTPLERLLAERVVITWLAVHRADLEAVACDGSLVGLVDRSAAGRAERLFHARRQESAQRRYLQSLRSLAQVRQLLKSSSKQIESGGVRIHGTRTSTGASGGGWRRRAVSTSDFAGSAVNSLR